MTETKSFPVRVLLTVTTGRLLTWGDSQGGNSIGELYEILDWMTDDPPFTHQLGRFANECKPWLLRWFPELAKVDASDLAAIGLAIKELGGERGVESWLEYVAQSYQLLAVYDVPRIPPDDHDHIPAYDELVSMRGTDEGIIVVESPNKS